jgi:transcription antitermination factor NusG
VSLYSLPFDPSCPHWFVLYVRANQEKKTALRLTNNDVEHFFPCYRSVRQWKDRRVTLEMPLFPGYIFVRLPFIDRVKVLSLPHVVDMVGGKNAPAIVSSEEIDCIKKGVEFGNATPHSALVEGQPVVITSGVLCGMQGTLLRNQNNTRVVVAINSIARSFAVDVDISCLKPTGEFLPQERKAV